MFRKICFFLILLSVFSCEKKSEVEREIEKIPIEFNLVRFDKEFAAVNAEKLPALKSKYPFLFPSNYPDSLWLVKINDSIQQELNTEVLSAFPNFDKEEEELQSLFQHIEYYFPSFESPEVFTITSEVDYKNKVLLANNYLFISLDTYLGKEHPFYMGIQEFLKKNFEKDQILPDVANAYAKKYVPQPTSRVFLDHMLYYGKILYLKDKWLTETPDFNKIGYTSKEMDWAVANEDQIWRYFVERKLIFDSDTQLYTRFLYPAPFSKFYLELDNEAPAMLGQFIGWQIVRAYMDKNDVGLQELLDTDAETIFNKANYKPKK
ncbi:gliding motility lipoprotein GldB [Gillisia sp. M10.2A]|uniref:Gliding motility lipoprotein GldB n=1 Tax=Gillisia lutea TaxID=2909668 RepID=A0ABS9EGP1_9FLAO|nr:gliding motility lipoprotein GldB [Gillisia lutea]MCF4102021.1 gliding motility lipoprotein GldB [Gillisia lutea]